MDSPVRQEELTSLLHSLAPAELAWLRQQLLRRDSAALLQGSSRLSRQELLAAEAWFWQQAAAANSPRERWARLRMWLVFMLLRHGALRLQEVFSLCREHLDWQHGCIQVPGPQTREVPLPLEVSHRLGRVLDDPGLCPPDGPLTRCDASLVRRVMARCNAACGLPKGLLCARSLRRSRALELARQGLPLPALDIFLGRRTSPAGLMRCDTAEARRILRQHIQKERPMQTSARNVFQGRITHLHHYGLLVDVRLVTAGGLTILARITDESCHRLALVEGKLVNASVKAPWVLVSPLAAVPLDAENSYDAVVERVREDAMAVEIVAALPEGTQICALLRKETAVPPALEAGARVRVGFGAFAVILNLD